MKYVKPIKNFVEIRCKGNKDVEILLNDLRANSTLKEKLKFYKKRVALQKAILLNVPAAIDESTILSSLTIAYYIRKDEIKILRKDKAQEMKLTKTRSFYWFQHF